jgi:peptidyl-tRNA hydrolase
MWEDVTVAYKMVIVMNTGLNMGIGKIASQV